jgi:hypothetical protein
MRGGDSRHGGAGSGDVRADDVALAVAFRTGGYPVTASREEFAELMQVNAITFGRMRAETFLELQIIEKFLD